MASKGPRPAILLLLLAAGLALASGHGWNPLHDLFRKNHVDNPRSEAANLNAYCNKMMWDRVLLGKPSNTFIHSPIRDINKVCTTEGKGAGLNKRRSNKPFKITVCTLIPWLFTYIGVSAEANILISCWDNVAVFYVRSSQSIA